MKNVKLKVLTVIVGSMLASNYAMADNTELLSKPKDRTVFTGKAPTINGSSSNQVGLNAANANSSSSNGVFQQKFGVTPNEGEHQLDPRLANLREYQQQQIQRFYDPAKMQNLINEQNKNLSEANLEKEQLRKELEATKKALNESNTKLSKAEKMYGDLDDAEDNSVPSVSKAVITSAPKYKNVNAGTDIKVTPGVNQIITISTDQPNRIITPFQNPQILSSSLTGGANGQCGEVCVKGSVVYVSTKKEYPLGLFITEKGQDQTAISLTLVPRRIPPREVNLVLNDSSAITVQGSPESKVWETSQPFVNGIKKNLMGIALGNIPSGYNLQKIPSNYALPVCSQAGLNFDFSKGQLLAGTNLNYVIGKITNVGETPIEFTESSCGGYDVAAVAAYPYNLLQPKQSTEVYVVQRVNANKNVKTTKRRSLLQ